MCMYRYNFFTVIKEKLRGATNCLPFQQIVVSRGFKHNIYIRYKSRRGSKGGLCRCFSSKLLL